MTTEDLRQRQLEKRRKMLLTITDEEIREYGREAARQLTWEPIVWNFKKDAAKRRN